jgi:hypothetical protein
MGVFVCKTRSVPKAPHTISVYLFPRAYGPIHFIACGKKWAGSFCIGGHVFPRAVLQYIGCMVTETYYPCNGNTGSGDTASTNNGHGENSFLNQFQDVKVHRTKFRKSQDLKVPQELS